MSGECSPISVPITRNDYDENCLTGTHEEHVHAIQATHRGSNPSSGLDIETEDITLKIKININNSGWRS